MNIAAEARFYACFGIPEERAPQVGPGFKTFAILHNFGGKFAGVVFFGTGAPVEN